jgi:hypothetical protein
MNDKAICKEPCMFCESHEHCADAHPFNSLDELINDIGVGKHIPCGISEKNAQIIRNEIRQAFRTYLRKQSDSSPELVYIEE